MTPAHTLADCRDDLCPEHHPRAAVDLKVRKNALNAKDARNILEHLGILAPGGREILPDPAPATLHTEATKVPTQPDPWSSPRAQADSGRRPDGCSTPAGLYGGAA